METIFHAASIYFFLFLLFRLIGARSLAESTPFDLVLLLIVSEATQQAMIGSDSSLATAFIAIGTLVGLDTLLSLLRSRVPSFRLILEQKPQTLMSKGTVYFPTLRKQHVLVEDIVASAREAHGIEKLEQIDSAFLESSGRISIIPKGPAS